MFNDLRPILPFVVQQVGSQVQIKPFSGYYTWLDWFDLAAYDQSAAVAALEEAVATAQATAEAAGGIAATAQATAEAAVDLAILAQGTADTGVANAATAQAAADAAQADATAALAAAGAIGVDYASTHFIIPRATKAISVGFGAFGVATTDALNGGYTMTGLNSEVQVRLPLANASWRFTAMVAFFSSAGKVTLYVDGAAQAELDMYNATRLPNQELTWDFVSGFEGYHDLRIKVTSKRAASSNYSMGCNYMTLHRL